MSNGEAAAPQAALDPPHHGGPPNGLLAVAKPWGWTSHDVVAAVRRCTRTRAVGHAGTLDPLASGVLVLALGPATRVLDAVMDLPKCYVAEIRLGATSATDDAEGPLLTQTPLAGVGAREVEAALGGLLGDLAQRPPSYAAIKVAGQPAYKAARRGLDVALPPRAVTIYGLAVLRLRLPYLTLAVWCSRGTYIRALARDLGERLSTGAYLAALLRAAVGPFHIRDALSLDELTALAARGQLAEQLYPAETALAGRPVLVACGAAAADVAHGRPVRVVPSEAEGGAPVDTRREGSAAYRTPSWALGPDGRLLALGDLALETPAQMPRDGAARPGSDRATGTDDVGHGAGGTSPRGATWQPRRVFAR